MFSITDMYNNVGTQAGLPIPPTNSQPNPFGNAFYGASSGLIRGGLGAYGEKILGSSSEYVQSNVSGIKGYDLRDPSCLCLKENSMYDILHTVILVAICLRSKFYYLYICMIDWVLAL